MKKLLTILAALAILASGTVNAQVAEKLTAHRLDRPWTSSSFVAPSGCVSSSVPFFGAAVTLGCDAGLTYDAATDKLSVGAIRIGTSTTAGWVLTSDANGVGSWAAGGGGITNSAGANVITKSDGTNLVATALSEASAGAIATSAGTALGLTATAPAATTGASQAGKGVTITASPAVASTDTAGAAAGGDVTITAGDAARNVSGDANGGDIIVGHGAAIGTGRAGIMRAAGSVQGGLRFGTSFTAVSWVAASATTWYGSLSNNGITLSSSLAYGWASGTTETSNNDTLVRRRGAANPAWGAASATPVAYLHNLAADSRAGTDTNVRGGAADLAPGVGTGTGGSGQFALQTAYPGSTGTSANTLTDRVFMESVWTMLTEASATNFAKLTYGASTAVGAEFFVTVEANDGTEYQSYTSRVRVSSVRKATGNTVSQVNEVGTGLTAASSGTLTVTFAVSEGSDGVTVQANAASSLTQTTLRISYQAVVNGPATVGAP